MKYGCNCINPKKKNMFAKTIDEFGGIDVWYCKKCNSYLRDSMGFIVEADKKISCDQND